jgi:uncharacterized membrane protein SirB2
VNLYLSLKWLHVGTVVTSGILFLWRLQLALRRPERLQMAAFRVVPHVIDTVLLVSGIGLVLLTSMYPFVQGWLTAKVFALIVYIILGSLALKRFSRPGARVGAGSTAIAVYAYMIAVAITKTPFPWVNWALLYSPKEF